MPKCEAPITVNAVLVLINYVCINIGFLSIFFYFSQSFCFLYHRYTPCAFPFPFHDDVLGKRDVTDAPLDLFSVLSSLHIHQHCFSTLFVRFLKLFLTWRAHPHMYPIEQIIFRIVFVSSKKLQLYLESIFCIAVNIDSHWNLIKLSTKRNQVDLFVMTG